MVKWTVWDGQRISPIDTAWVINGELVHCDVVHKIERVCFVRQKDDGQFYAYRWGGGMDETGPYQTLEAAKLAAELIYI